MTQKKKKIIIVGTSLAATALIIMGGQYMAGQIIANRLEQQKAQNVIATETLRPESNLSISEDIPEETTVYDDNGNVAIEPEETEQPTTDAASGENNVELPTLEANPPEPAKQTDAKPKASTSDKTTASESTEKSTSSSSATTSPSTKTSDTSSNSSNSANSSDSDDGKVYVPGFGYMESEGEGAAIQGEYQGGDHNKIVGH